MLTKCLCSLGRNRFLMFPWKSLYASSFGSPGMRRPCIAYLGLPTRTTRAQKASCEGRTKKKKGKLSHAFLWDQICPISVRPHVLVMWHGHTSSLRYINRTPAILFIPWQYPRLCKNINKTVQFFGQFHIIRAVYISTYWVVHRVGHKNMKQSLLSVQEGGGGEGRRREEEGRKREGGR